MEEPQTEKTAEEGLEQAQAPKEPRRFAVGVKLRQAGPIYTFSSDDPTLAIDEPVVVESEGGEAFALIAGPPVEAAEERLPAASKRIIRRFNDEDRREAALRRERAIECLNICRERIAARQMHMKLVDVEITDGGKKAVFVFFSEQRIDFRSLVKDLAGILRMRIEMRQVGARDHSKIAGCLGPCGLTTCCSTHLRQFKSISISMAKHQGLAPNPAKLTGMCGKLKCCLSYESAAYDECRKGLPKVGGAVRTPAGDGKVTGHNVLKRECIVKLYAGGEERFPCDNCQRLSVEERDSSIAEARRVREEGEAKRRSRRDDTRRKGGKR